MGKTLLDNKADDAVGVEHKVFAINILGAQHRHHRLHLVGEMQHVHLGILIA